MARILRRLRWVFLLVVSWLSAPPIESAAPEASEPPIEPPEPSIAAAPATIDPPPAAIPPLPLTDIVFPHRPGKWVKPKGLIEPLPLRPPPAAPKAEARPRRPRTTERLQEDPEQWGQYYFRDVILDQLDRYWVYLRRMKRGDLDSYKLLRQIGIQLLPYSATSQFDRWSATDDDPQLSGWWHSNRPTFGAIAYGFDDVAMLGESIRCADLSDPAGDPDSRRWMDKINKALDGRLAHRPSLMSKASGKYDRKASDRPSTIWTPRFLYFHKYARPPTDIESQEGGDIYKLTVYWDRCDRDVAKHWRSKRGGGVPQSYGVWIERGGHRIRILRTKINEKIELKWAKGPHGGSAGQNSISFTHARWMVPDNYLSWTHRGREHGKIEPQEYLRRLFVEAATMYESATLGSMVRVAVARRDLTAVFGVEIKRTPYFFKDRDIVLSESGTKKRIFHIVRPHVRANGEAVPMHFRGLRDFAWAGYQVSITVPGRDHFLLPEFDVGMLDAKPGPIPADMLGSDKIGRNLNRYIKTGVGALK